MNMKTNFGEFYFREHKGARKDYSVIFLSGLGVNSAYYDFYNLLNELASQTSFNLISVDLLGSGLSGIPNNANRSLEVISNEINTFVNHLACKKVIFCCHSYSSLYVLNLICHSENFFMNYTIEGFIGIDPTASSVMQHFMDDFDYLLKEATKVKEEKEQGIVFKIDNSDINPLLPDNEFKNCQTLYSRLMGNNYQIAEISGAKKTIEKLAHSSIENIPSLSILSSLNYNDYKKYGNPYFNSNPNSIEVVLNSHHYVHWKHLKKVTSIIMMFLNQF